MKVLFITNNFLDSPGGGSFASYAFVNAFSEIAEACLLLYPDNGKEIRPYIHEKIILKGIDNKKSKLGKLIDIYRGRINRYTDVVIPEMISFHPDIIVFDGSRSSAGLIKRVKSIGGKVITIHHNYEMEYYKGTPPPIFWRIPLMYYMKKAERTAVQISNLNLTLTNQDLDLLQLHYDSDKKAEIKKLGCFEPMLLSGGKNQNDNLQMRINAGHNIEKLIFIISGSLSSRQTEVSLVPFLKKIYPFLLRKLPESKLIIAGQKPSKKLKKVCAKYSSINLIPNPDDMQLITDQADVYICPTCVGGGLKLRIMDGLKVGLPVLTHEVSARGYDDFIKAGFMFVYNDIHSFKKCLKLYLSEIENGRFIKSKIQELYLSLFSYESGVKRLKKILTDYNLADN